MPVPTIHYYRRLGLLPEPMVVAANRYLYDERHVEALLVIRHLREERALSLATIAEVLPELLANDSEEAFRSDMWDQVVAAHLEDVARSEPSARLVVAAREAFSRDGYADVSVAGICAAAELATGSFYRHFDSKESMFVAAVRSVGDVIGAEMDRWPARMSRARASNALQAVLEPFVPLLLEATLREGRGAPELAGVMAEVTGVAVARLQPHMRGTGSDGDRAARLVVRDTWVVLLQRPLGLR